MELDPHVRAFYELGRESNRLFDHTRTGPLERERTMELILRDLPGEPQRILDVGGGPGTYARWLGDLGHEVSLVDPVPLHVEQARADGVAATIGDARWLEADDDSVDVVLLLGPLYHLLDADDRRTALAEAARVLRPGGLLFAAAIARFAALFDLLVRLDGLDDTTLGIVREAVRSGRFLGGSTIFTNAYFHLPDELRHEVGKAGFEDAQVYNVEGPGFLVRDFEARWLDPARREVLLDAARMVESEAAMMAATSHLLAVGRLTGD